MIETYFAPAERAKQDELQKGIATVSNHPLTGELLKVVTGLLAVLNEHRQILAVNDALLKMMDVDDAEKLLGLRPGEYIKCIHADAHSGGCGTSEFCETCGAAVAIVTSICNKKPAERMCVVTVLKNKKKADLIFKVRCCPININNTFFYLLFLQDVSKHQQCAIFEKLFFHDINNILQGIMGKSEMMTLFPDAIKQRHTKEIYQLAQRLSNNIEIHKYLSQSAPHDYKPLYKETTLAQIFVEIKQIFSHHLLTKDNNLILPEIIPDITIRTDPSLVIRILNNMITNALEASESGDHVKLLVHRESNWIIFRVWNRQTIPKNIAKRIFQRNFSTKEAFGRGLGTFSMKYFGEEILGGKIDFTTSKEEGTWFKFQLFI